MARALSKFILRVYKTFPCCLEFSLGTWTLHGISSPHKCEPHLWWADGWWRILSILQHTTLLHLFCDHVRKPLGMQKLPTVFHSNSFLCTRVAMELFASLQLSVEELPALTIHSGSTEASQGWGQVSRDEIYFSIHSQSTRDKVSASRSISISDFDVLIAMRILAIICTKVPMA